MLKLTDDELTRIFQATAPIAIERRDDFLEAVAAILLGSAGPIGSGTVHRAIAQAQRSTSIRRKTTALQAARDGTATRLGSRRSASRRRAEGRSPDTETTWRLNVRSWLAAGCRCLSPWLSLMLLGSCVRRPMLLCALTRTRRV